MKDPRITDLVKEEAEKMYEESGCLSLWMLTRRVARSIGISTEVIVWNLTGLGYVEIAQGAFVLKDDIESPKAKKLRDLDGTAFSFMLSNERAQDPVEQDFIERNKKGKKIQAKDYRIYSINALRSLATGKGIKGVFSMKKEELIKRITSKSSE